MGIFDRSTAGHITPPVDVTLERGAIAFFAETIGETNPIHFDVDAARSAGHPDVVAPATYPVVVGTFAGNESARKGSPGILDLIKADMRHLLHGTESYTYHGTMYAGETVSVVNEVLGFVDAKGGKLEIAQVATRITHLERGLIVEAKRDIIHVLG